MTLSIISSAHDITPEWLTELLRSSGDLDAEATVATARVEPFGSDESMMSALYRVHVSFDGETNAPTSLVVKLSSDSEGARFIASMFGFYEREIVFYNELLPKVSIRTARCLHAEMYPDDQGFVLVLEEVTGHRQVDQVEGMNFDDAMVTVEMLADLHAPNWGADLTEISETMLPFSSEVLQQVVPAKSLADWEMVRPMMADELPGEVVGLIDRFGEIMPKVMDDMMGHDTVVHGDCRADNMLFDDDGNILVLDFQLMAVCNGMFDVSYLVSQSLESAAQDRASELVDGYLARVASHGIEVDLEHATQAYRAAVVFNIGLAISVLATEGLPERSALLGRAMMERAAREVLRTDGHVYYA
ncbi:MAG: phosphotransferase [Ilumatobacter sp.]